MNAIRVETMVEADGELHLKDLPCRRGDNVEVIVLILEHSLPSRTAERESARAAALDQFLALAKSSSFCSTKPYPSRDELHERH